MKKKTKKKMKKTKKGKTIKKKKKILGVSTTRKENEETGTVCLNKCTYVIDPNTGKECGSPCAKWKGHDGPHRCAIHA